MIFGLESWLAGTLFLCLLAAIVFEFINGFHDTANAVATVIYTNTLKPWTAVVWSGLWNIAGVLAGGIGVAMGIVYLLPVELLVDQQVNHAVAMIIALLGSSIAWNFSTWYLGIPCSSSHTLVAAILGVGVAHSILPGASGTAVNWDKAIEVGSSLLISPFFGFAFTILLMFILRWFTKGKKLFEEPKKKEVPPLWIRAILVFTCTSVSFFHGSNDGQKGVGVIMLILIGLVPLQFALNPQMKLPDVKSASTHLATELSEIAAQSSASSPRAAEAALLSSRFTLLARQLDDIPNNVANSKFEVRKVIITERRNLDRFEKNHKFDLTTAQKKNLSFHKKTIVSATDYVPFWVLIMVSLSLGTGTMVGWKRIVVTIGEKIGKQHLTYAQGASAEIVAASTIGMSTFLGLPVSTTQVLSSGIAGSMVASKGLKNLQMGTVKNMAIAWLLTFPVVFMLAGTLFYLLREFWA
ncbi:MAG: anion permease [Imperialibacter sp.]|uniref:inorganic phosphate transporter n=1 Tax=Imperialibacter sp. TaxID=2038411 RepID=UPI0032F01A10